MSGSNEIRAKTKKPPGWIPPVVIEAKTIKSPDNIPQKLPVVIEATTKKSPGEIPQKHQVANIEKSSPKPPAPTEPYITLKFSDSMSMAKLLNYPTDIVETILTYSNLKKMQEKYLNNKVKKIRTWREYVYYIEPSTDSKSRIKFKISPSSKVFESDYTYDQLDKFPDNNEIKLHKDDWAALDADVTTENGLTRKQKFGLTLLKVPKNFGAIQMKSVCCM